MRKIDIDGPYGGKNVMLFDDEGKLVPKCEMNRRSEYMESLEKDKELQIQDADEMSSDSDQY